MPLHILVPMILIGLPLVIGIVYWTGREKEKPALSQELIRTRFAEDFPAFDVREAIISDNGNSALLFPADNSEAGLLHSMGQNYLTRLLGKDFVREVKETPQGIDLYVNDFTLKRIAFPLTDDRHRAKVLKKLSVM